MLWAYVVTPRYFMSVLAGLLTHWDIQTPLSSIRVVRTLVTICLLGRVLSRLVDGDGKKGNHERLMFK